jgi:chemotaxis-related protein WspB
MLVLTFQVGSDHLALEVGRIRELVPCVRLQPVACSPPWLAGVFIYRGRVVPVIDLHRLFGVGECPLHLGTRIILVPHVFDRQERLVGLLAAKVADVREMQPPSPMPIGFVPGLQFGNEPGRPDLGPVIVDGREIVHLVELDRLLPELYDGKLPLVAKEPPA